MWSTSSFVVNLPNENLIERLVNTRKWSVESDEKWIITEKEQGSFDYDLEEVKPIKSPIKSNG